jgi:hypothetical protein
MVGKPRIGSWPAFGYGVGASNVARRARNARALGAVGAGFLVVASRGLISADATVLLTRGGHQEPAVGADAEVSDGAIGE